jgi:preprotein translocase subunit SecA
MAKRMQFQHAEAASALSGDSEQQDGEQVAVAAEPVRAEPKIGRNEPCPCGSGKKYKHCHGQPS